MYTVTLQSVSDHVLLCEYRAALKTFDASETHRAEFSAICCEMIERRMTHLFRF